MKAVEIVYATDERGVLGCVTSAVSVLTNLPSNAGATVWVIHTGLSEAATERFREGIGGNTNVNFVYADPKCFEGLLHAKNIPPVAYARLKMPSLLPPSVRRVIYLDIDTVVNAPIEDLWNTDTRGRALAAVPNGDSRSMATDCDRLGIVGTRYFGSGVMICDLDVWRERQIEERAIRFANDLGERLIMHDQDALNGVMDGDWIELDTRWNWWAIRGGPWDGKLIHYTMTPKPWDPDYQGPGRDVFDRYAERAGVLGQIERRRRWPRPVIARLRRRIPYWPTVLRVCKRRLGFDKRR